MAVNGHWKISSWTNSNAFAPQTPSEHIAALIAKLQELEGFPEDQI